MCADRAGVRYDCIGLRNSKATDNYYCDEATRQEITIENEGEKCPDVIVVAYDIDGKKHYCSGIGEGQTCKRADELVMPFG